MVGSGLILLGLLSLAIILSGLIYTWVLTPFDLRERWAEWRLFVDGIYPSAMLATPLQRSLPDFRTTVYFPWALPLFTPFFAPGGLMQATWLLHSLNLLSLVLIARIGLSSLRAFGAAAGWLGAMAPLAIAGNCNALNKGQFSILCVGLISLQWLFIQRQRTLPAGVCWALAMLKPQIGLTFALPFLTRKRLPGLLLALGILAGLSFLALIHTNVGINRYLLSWIQVVPQFMGTANLNALALVTTLFSGTPIVSLILISGVAGVVAGLWALLGRRRRSALARTVKSLLVGDPLTVAAVCALLGQLGFYHRFYDNIMLYPVLLVLFRHALRRPRFLEVGLAISMAATVWTPQRLLDALPGSTLAQTLIWILVGAFLLLELIVPSSRSISLDAS